MFGIDCHTHSGNSPDGTGTVGGLCRRAISLGLEALAITEHVELNRWHSQGYYGTTPRNDEEEYSYYKRMEKAMKDNHAAKEAYGNRLHIISGIELGQIPCDFGLADSVMQDNRLDFVIASLHELKNKPDFYFLNYRTEDVPKLLEQYFSELLTLCQWGKFDVLGHMTYPLRYIEGEAGMPVDLSAYEEQIHECLKALVNNGCGLELNTSGLRQKYGKPFPTLEYIKLYREMGGESLSIGSDAHCAEDVGSGIKEAPLHCKGSRILLSLLLLRARTRLYSHSIKSIFCIIAERKYQKIRKVDGYAKVNLFAATKRPSVQRTACGYAGKNGRRSGGGYSETGRRRHYQRIQCHSERRSH